MTCSLQTYRIRIGTFQPSYKKKSYSSNRSPGASSNGTPPGTVLTSVYLIILLSSYYVLSTPTCSGQYSHEQGNLCKYHIQPDSSHKEHNLCTGGSITWDPGISLETMATATIFSGMPSAKLNKLVHIKYGNRGPRGKGIKILYWNKGPSFLHNKQGDIETMVASHKPHILGLGEANFRHDHDLVDVQRHGYTLHLDSCLQNPELGMARVAVYTHSSLRVKRRHDLEDINTAAVWLECGLPKQRGILVCIGYRQWRLLGQKDNSSATTQEQLVRWLVFIEKWEKAAQENKEIIVAMDANLDFLTWRSEGLPANHSSVRLKSLAYALFDRILPLGFTQLVTRATRME